jgi:hypothetical protein
MDGAAMSVIMGGLGALEEAKLMYCVTRRMQPIGSIRKVSIRSCKGVMVVGLSALTL